MKNLILSTTLTVLAICAACGAKADSAAGNKTNSVATESKSSINDSSSKSAASAVVKEIYDDAMRRNCSAIPTKLTDEFKKGVGTSQDSLEALCDTFTDSGKLASFEIKSEDLKGDKGTVKVGLTYKDGKKEEKEERVEKVGDKWRMAS